MIKELLHIKVGFQSVLLGLLIFTTGCSGDIKNYKEVSQNLPIFPDYAGITLPPNIAPLNFTIHAKAEKYSVKISAEIGKPILISSADGNIIIPINQWKTLLGQNRGKSIQVDLFLKKEGQWLKYNTITNHIALDSIDPYLVYRLIEPGYETWNKMGIYQRCLENYNESPVMINEMSDGNCMNCHSFSQNNHNTMLFHVRAKHGGTIIMRNGKITKVDTKTDSTLSAGVYPAWHPGGRYVAFSVNRIVQSFHAIPDRKIEVVDTLSDLILYDAETNKVFNHKSISSANSYETFPTWSPDGKFLYFCSAKFQLYKDYQQIKYDLLRVSFDTATESFGTVDTVINASSDNYSISFPRISPNGEYLMYTRSRYGNFTIWHDDSDLFLLNLKSGEISKPDINSDKSESYHNWSSSSRWLVFSSRRIDGHYTRPYFTYIDSLGKVHKPFLLPQKNPEFYVHFLKSYNIPEMVTSKIPLDPRKLEKIVKSEAQKASFEKKL